MSSGPPNDSRHCRRSLIAAACLSLVLAACAARPLEIGREPELSPVGSGMGPRAPAGHASVELPPVVTGSVGKPPASDSLWRDRGGDLFKDPRARRNGDILTVTISIKDRASLDNSSKRSRDASHGIGVDISHDIDWRALALSGSAAANSSIKANTAQDGKGAIARSESIDLRLAAVVSDVLPNGNLLIQGTQEVRVNYELRVLTFSGIVNVADIRADNTIPYERVAEARMSYGGRGRIMEVQQPGWGQQVIDLLMPF